MGYVRTAGMSTAARRRRRRTALVLIALVTLLLAVFGYAAAYYLGWIGNESSNTSSTDETSQTTQAPEQGMMPADVTVNVYNSSGASGVAGRTASALESRGFRINSVENDPENADVQHAADIRHGPDGLEAAQLLQEYIPGAQLVELEREGEVIDIALGAEFEELPQTPAEDTTEEPTSTE